MSEKTTILICEEDATAASRLADICRGNAHGCMINTVTDGSSAFRIITGNQPIHLIVFGTLENGPDVLTAMRRAAEKFNDIEIITAHADGKVRAEHTEAGCTTEISPSRLLAALPQFVRNAADK